MAATAAAHDAIDDVRAFNRFYTRVIGVLDDGVVETSYSLPEARVLFELAQVDEREVGEVRRALGIDAGYLSRMLARFEAQGLIARRRSAERRPPPARPADRARARPSSRCSTVARPIRFRGLLARLGEPSSAASLRRWRAVRELLGDDASGRDARAARARARRLRMDRRAPRRAVRRGVRLELAHRVARGARDRRVHASTAIPRASAPGSREVDGVRAGCVLCARRSDDVAQLRMLIVEPSARGLGLGGMLVDECMRFARDAGYRSMLLWTTNVLEPARRLYQRAGFELVEQAPFQRFGPDLVGEYWRCEPLRLQA